MSSDRSLKLDWCTLQSAKYACEKWHYSRCVPRQKTVKIGVWESGSFVGCVLFGDGANPGMFAPYGVGYEQGCELVRVALAKHKSPVSRIVRFAFMFLKKACPQIRLIVSFADPEQGHHGGIYQAGGWLYAGMTDPADEYIVNGVRMHGRALRATRTSHRAGRVPAANVYEWARKILDPKIARVVGSSKHRYLMPLDAEMRARILPLAKPYPKRAGSADSGTPGIQPGGGGATPTPALDGGDA
jgi:hypothetical protein